MPNPCCKEFYAKIPDDEPVFTLVAHDDLAEKTVMFWITHAIDEGVNPDKVKRGIQHLYWIRDYRASHPERCKLPD